MFKNNDLYNADDMLDAINDKTIMLECMIKIDVLLEILKQNKITDDYAVDACTRYVESKPDYKAVKEFFENSRRKALSYKANPEQHLKDLFQAKLNGRL